MAQPPLLRAALREAVLDVTSLLAEAARPDAGATVLFLGTARDHSPAREGITHLEYEAYAEQVVPKLEEVLADAASRWPLLVALAEHRLGEVPVGQPSVAVVVSAAHRTEAFAAARFIIDELKRRVPLWKKEHWPGGGEWVLGA